jgi:hypothetical protein
MTGTRLVNKLSRISANLLTASAGNKRHAAVSLSKIIEHELYVNQPGLTLGNFYSIHGDTYTIHYTGSVAQIFKIVVV